MAQRVTCPQGHNWEFVAEESPAGEGLQALCPVCGAGMVTESCDSMAATLPPPSSMPRAAAPKSAAIPGYEILSELGRGGMGVVYRARQIQLNRAVALKMILAGNHAGEQDLARFRVEAEAVARFQHPNIVQIYEVGEQNGLPFFSFELVEGGSLADKLDGTPWPARQAAQLIATLAQAVHAAHELRVVHRDLKPANILLTTAGVPKITDFGLAKRLDVAGSQTKSGAIVGTPSYMAPEQAGNKSKSIGPAADIYSLGAILYELLTGRPPFRAATPLDTVLQLVCEEPVPPRSLHRKVPRDLETVCLKCLEKEPRHRYASAQELGEDLLRFVRGECVLARPLGVTGRLGRWARHRPALAATLAGLLILYANHLLFLFTGLEAEDGRYHWLVTGVVLAWALGATGFQWLASRPTWRTPATYGWAALDVLLFSILLLAGKGPSSALLVLYPLLVAGAGLRFRIGLVWFVTTLCLLSYLAVVAYALWIRPDRDLEAHAVIIFALSLVLMGLMIHLLLRRFRSALAAET
jgi:hypothetical protein